jgi:hypothetical protein
MREALFSSRVGHLAGAERRLKPAPPDHGYRPLEPGL